MCFGEAVPAQDKIITKRTKLTIIDLFSINLLSLAVQWLMFSRITSGFVVFTAIVSVIDAAVLHFFNFYSHRIEGSSLELVWDTAGCLSAITVSGVIVCGLRSGFASKDVRFLIVMQLVSFCAILFSRVAFRSLKENIALINQGKLDKAIVYGAGELGTTIARISSSGHFDYKIAGFVDDNPDLKGRFILRYPVLGSSEDFDTVFKETDAKVFIIAISKIKPEKIQNAVEKAKKNGLEVKIISKLFETKGSTSVSVRDIDYADLLGRDLITIDRKPLEEMFTGKTILVTGAGGSIGSEICSQLLTYNLEKLILLDVDETELHDLTLRLLDYRKEWSEDVVPVVCDIKNGEKLQRVFSKFKPDIVFHAAAYKHVPLMELYPEEAILTNIPGSFNVFKAASDNNVKRVVVISTDKAVNPTNIMGATKRTVELMASTFNAKTDTDFVCVRFGNVIGSRGSMLPLFLEQIKNGKPITVTDRKIYRYFMAIPEAVSLVFRAASLAQGGEVMVLDMGEPVNIYDFAQKLISIFGDERSSIVVTGLRPGEKLYEELLANKDNTIPTQEKKIFKAKITTREDWTLDYLENTMARLKTLNPEDLVKELKDTVPEYAPKENK